MYQVFDSDAYGVDTDNPESASEMIENHLTKKEEEIIRTAMKDFAKDLASVFFVGTDEWGDEEWEAWIDKTRESML